MLKISKLNLLLMYLLQTGFEINSRLRPTSLQVLKSLFPFLFPLNDGSDEGHKSKYVLVAGHSSPIQSEMRS